MTSKWLWRDDKHSTWSSATSSPGFTELFIIRQRSWYRRFTVLQTVMDVRSLPLGVFTIVLNLWRVRNIVTSLCQHLVCNIQTLYVLSLHVQWRTLHSRASECHQSLKVCLVPCKYSKFRIELNSYFSIRNKHSYSKFSNTYCHQFLTYLTEWRRFFTLATTPSNQQNQQTWSRHCRLKTLNVV